MGNTRKPRKRYKPMQVDNDPIGLAMTSAAKLVPDQQAVLNGNAARAFDAMRAGKGTEEHWQALAGVMNVAEQLARDGVARNHEEAFVRGQQALLRVWERQAAGRSWTMYASEITTLDDALWLYGVQLQHVSQGELRAARRTVEHKWTQALAGNAPSGALVRGRRSGPGSSEHSTTPSHSGATA